MKSVIFLALIALFTPLAAMADDFEIIPKVEKGDMKKIKEAFGKSIAESKRGEPERPAVTANEETPPEGEKAPKDNFGAKASAEAKRLREQGEHKGAMGAWARQNNPGAEHRSDSARPGEGKAQGARDAAPGGGRPEEAGGKGSSKGKSKNN
jgi:hypothetical protein